MIRLEVFEDGKYIYAANDKVICLYNRDKNQTLYKYEKQGEPLGLNFAVPVYIADNQMIAFSTLKFAMELPFI